MFNLKQRICSLSLQRNILSTQNPLLSRTPWPSTHSFYLFLDPPLLTFAQKPSPPSKRGSNLTCCAYVRGYRTSSQIEINKIKKCWKKMFWTNACLHKFQKRINSILSEWFMFYCLYVFGVVQKLRNANFGHFWPLPLYNET